MVYIIDKQYVGVVEKALRDCKNTKILKVYVSLQIQLGKVNFAIC